MVGRPVILPAVFLLVVVKIPFLARNKMEVSCTFGVVVLTYTVFNNVYFLLHSVFISLFASASLSLVMFFNCFIYGCKGFSSFQFAQQFSLLSSVVISNIFHQTQIFLMFSHLLLCRFSPKSSPCPSCFYRALRWGRSWVSTSHASRIFWGSSCFCALPGLLALPASWSPWLLSAYAAHVWVLHHHSLCVCFWVSLFLLFPPKMWH